MKSWIFSWIFVAALAGCLPCGAASAAQPSFDCAKATSPTEKAICADDGLAALDRSLATAFRDFKRNDKLLADSIGDEQADFIKARDACVADSACLTRVMQRRRSQLLLQPDKAVADPRERFVGRYQNEDGYAIVEESLDGGYELDGSMGDPEGHWTCDLNGPIDAKLDDGSATAKVGDGGTLPVYLALKPHALELSEDADHPLAGDVCGAEGHVDGDYKRVPSLNR